MTTMYQNCPISLFKVTQKLDLKLLAIQKPYKSKNKLETKVKTCWCNAFYKIHRKENMIGMSYISTESHINNLTILNCFCHWKCFFRNIVFFPYVHCLMNISCISKKIWEHQASHHVINWTCLQWAKANWTASSNWLIHNHDSNKWSRI